MVVLDDQIIPLDIQVSMSNVKAIGQAYCHLLLLSIHLHNAFVSDVLSIHGIICMEIVVAYLVVLGSGNSIKGKNTGL